MSAFVNCLVVNVFLCLTSTCTGQDIVRIKNGQIKGFKEEYAPGKSVTHFLGIPYAQPPTGDTRFRKAVPAKPWSGVLDATKLSHACMQVPINEDRNFTFNEDCLYLNVYVPQVSGNASLPVMVWIHGGGLIFGTSATRQGHVLARKGVIVVGPNYRLGLFGFLTSSDQEAPGNAGLLDQVLALQWVQDNVAAFGGDPKQVTVFGESAGGTSVSLLTVSPLARGLFHAAVMQSGVSLSAASSSDKPPPSEQVQTLGKLAGCTDTSSLLPCLRKKSAEELLNASVSSSSAYFRWGPVVDGPSGFLPDQPHRLMAKGQLAKVPIIRGCNADEASGNVLGIPNINQGLQYNEFVRLVNNFVNSRYRIRREQIEAEIIKVYTRHLNTSDKEAVRKTYIQLLTDSGLGSSTVLANQLTAGLPDQPPVYFYVFDYKSPSSPWQDWRGVPHASELLYVFGFPWLPPSQGPVTAFNQDWSQTDKEVSDDVMTLWTNFAKHSNPTPQPVRGVTWGRFTAQHQAYLHIRHPSTLEVNFHAEEIKLWNEVIPKLVDPHNPDIVG